VGEREVELALVEFLDARFADFRVLDGRGLFPVASIASRLSNAAQDTARPDARSTIRLALQNPSRPSNSGRTDVL